jgi:transposase-like protein
MFVVLLHLTTTMPRKKRLEPLRRHYSDDLKERVIYQAFTLGKKSAEIALNLEIPLRVVQ